MQTEIHKKRRWNVKNESFSFSLFVLWQHSKHSERTQRCAHVKEEALCLFQMIHSKSDVKLIYCCRERNKKKKNERDNIMQSDNIQLQI